MEPERLANRLAHEARTAYQETADAALMPVSEEAAEQVRANWRPIEDFQKEGPHVGYRKETESEKGQRIN